MSNSHQYPPRTKLTQFEPMPVFIGSSNIRHG